MKNLVVSFLFLLPTFVAAAEAFPPIESSSQIEGCWKRVVFSEERMKLMNKIEPWPVPHQWFCFYDNNTMKMMMETEDNKHTKSALLEIFKFVPFGIEYEIIQPGVVLLNNKEANEKMYWLASLVNQTLPIEGRPVQPGALLMTLRNINTGKDEYFRILEKIN